MIPLSDKNVARVFIASSLNEEAKNLIKDIQSNIKKLNCQIKWVKPENVHLTLKFLGNIESDRIDELKKLVQSTSKMTQSIKSDLFNLGAFPNSQKPKILWVGLSDNESKIAQLAETIETSLSTIGFSKEKRSFKPHVTIGRVRSFKNIKPLSETISQFSVKNAVAQNIDNITIYKSTLTPTGPIYEVLKKFELA